MAKTNLDCSDILSRSEEGVLSVDLAHRMRRWRHSGFSAHNRIVGKAEDTDGRQRLACVSCFSSNIPA